VLELRYENDAKYLRKSGQVTRQFTTVRAAPGRPLGSLDVPCQTRSVVSDQAESAATVQLPTWVQATAAEVDLDRLCEVVVQADIAAAFSEYEADEVFVAALRASVRENLGALQAVLCGRLALSDVRLTEVLAFGAVQAQLRIPQSSLQRSYRVGFTAMWEEWSHQVEARAATAGVGLGEAIAALSELTRTIFAYQDRTASLVAETYIRADEALGRSRAHVRQQLIKRLLDGDDSGVVPSDLVTIGYDFDVHHLAVLLPQVTEGAAGQLLIGLRAATHARHSLVYSISLHGSVIWLSRPTAWTPASVDDLARVLDKAGVIASVSESEIALGGFRRSYDQVTRIEDVRAAWGVERAPRVIRYADVGLEILLLADEETARRFVQRELGALAASSAEGGRLRETLESSFRHGSHVDAASALAVHEHTIRNRLHRIEELLGHPVRERRTEMQVALRLVRILGGYL